MLLRLFPVGASADHPDLALAHAAVALAQGRLEEAAAQLALAESEVQTIPRLAAGASRWQSRRCGWRWHGGAASSRR